jgi:hypothetical protein
VYAVDAAFWDFENRLTMLPYLLPDTWKHLVSRREYQALGQLVDWRIYDHPQPTRGSADLWLIKVTRSLWGVRGAVVVQV